MEITPRQTGALALLALVPLVIYWLSTGRLTAVNVVVGTVNILLIASTVILAFSPETTLGEETPT